MNYVAHLFLAEPSDEHRIGSILADFTMGTMDRLRQKFGPAIARGIRHHREVDRYTDNHWAVLNSIDALKSDFGLYAGIVVDVVYDHFLLRHWDTFSPQNQGLFFEAVYRSLARDEWDYPARYRQVVNRIVEKKWLDSYIDLSMVAYALSRIGERFPRQTPLADALGGIKKNYAVLEQDFLCFFPELVLFSNTIDCEI